MFQVGQYYEVNIWGFSTFPENVAVQNESMCEMWWPTTNIRIRCAENERQQYRIVQKR